MGIAEGGPGKLPGEALRVLGILVAVLLAGLAGPPVLHEAAPLIAGGQDASTTQARVTSGDGGGYEEKTIEDEGLWVKLAYTPGLVLGVEASLKELNGRRFPVLVINASSCLSLKEVYRGERNLSELPLIGMILEEERLGEACRITLDFSSHPSSWLGLDANATLEVLLEDEAGGGRLQVLIGLGKAREGIGGPDEGNVESRVASGGGQDTYYQGIETVGPVREPVIVGEERGAGGFKFHNITLALLAFLVVAALVADFARARARGGH